MTPADCVLLPNLGAEEGDDWHAYSREASARVAARLWALLFSKTATLRSPSSHPPSPQPEGKPRAWVDRSVADLWPPSLGAPPSEPAYAWIQPPGSLLPWLRTASLDNQMGQEDAHPMSGPEPKIVARVHDKAFALEAARVLELLPESLSKLISVVEAQEFASPDLLLKILTARLASWPAWTDRRFTLKPRSGSSGRGRVAGTAILDTAAIRGAFPRLARRGGAIFEPWLERCVDLSVCLKIPEPGSGESLPTLLGSLELLVTASGVYRGHCGELDSRGRIYSGHPEDENLRSQAASLANRAHEVGYFGPCGVDAFVYREADRERLRPAVEFNARPTMGLVTLGLLRRARPQLRAELALEPGERGAFLFAMLPASEIASRIVEEAGSDAHSISLTRRDEDAAPVPVLFFSRDLAPLREAYRRHTGS